MRIIDILENKRTLSFEVFPPKKENGKLEELFRTIEELKDMSPDFISVTYGANGSNRRSNAEIAGFIKDQGIEPLAHLTCGPSSKEDIDSISKDLKDKGVSNILALRGDKPQDYSDEYCKTFKHPTELMEYMRPEGFSFGCACYPEGHIESESLRDDLIHMKEKEEKGATFFITQIFYDNQYYYRLVAEARMMGINSPIIPGIMPLTNPKSINRIKSMCGSTIPLDYRNMLEFYKDDKDSFEEVGINYAVYQIMDLLAKGAPGIHIYTMNQSKYAKEIINRIRNVRRNLL